MNCVPLLRLFGAANYLRSLFIQNVCLYFAGESNIESSPLPISRLTEHVWLGSLINDQQACPKGPLRGTGERLS